MQVIESIRYLLVVLFTASMTTLVVRSYYIKIISDGEDAYHELYEHTKRLEAKIGRSLVS